MAVVAVFAVFSTCILFPMLLFRSCENNMRLSEEERKQVWEMIEKESIDEKISAVTEYEIRTAGDGVYGKEELTDYTNKYAQEYLGVQSEYTDLTIDTNVLYEDGIVYVAVLVLRDRTNFWPFEFASSMTTRPSVRGRTETETSLCSGTVKSSVTSAWSTDTSATLRADFRI